VILYTDFGFDKLENSTILFDENNFSRNKILFTIKTFLITRYIEERKDLLQTFSHPQQQILNHLPQNIVYLTTRGLLITVSLKNPIPIVAPSFCCNGFQTTLSAM
jgi:hypothetical protein